MRGFYRFGTVRLHAYNAEIILQWNLDKIAYVIHSANLSLVWLSKLQAL